MSNGNGQPPASDENILEAVKRLSRRLDDRLVREQQRDQTTQQILASINHLTDAIHALQNVVHNEQDTTRRALLLHFGGADLVEKERGV